MELADRSGDPFRRMVSRTTLADALLHQVGRLQSSQVAFRQAEGLQAERQPHNPLLYSLPGFCYCHLLLERGLLEPETSTLISQPDKAADARAELSSWLTHCGEVRNRAEYALDLSTRFLGKGLGLIDIGLDNLTLGKTWLLEITIRFKDTREFSPPTDLMPLLQKAIHHLNQSVSLLHQAGTQHHIPHGLLARAALWRTNFEFRIPSSELTSKDYLGKADRDLTEVEQIADRSNMLIHQIEAALERCRLALAMGDHTQARTKLNQAKALVKQTERPYEPHIPTWDEWEPPAYVNVFQPGEIVGYHRRNGEIAELEQALE